jgi:hypothetical protein
VGRVVDAAGKGISGRMKSASWGCQPKSDRE